MKWLILFGCLGVGCAQADTPIVPGGPGPGVGARPDGGSGGVGGGGGQGGAGGEPQGACNNASDFDVIQNTSATLREIARDCGAVNNITNCFNLFGDAYERCIEDCIADELPGLSRECMGCYAAAERCGADAFCRVGCQFDSCSTQCLSCVTDAGCIDALSECTGLPGDGCPG